MPPLSTRSLRELGQGMPQQGIGQVFRGAVGGMAAGQRANAADELNRFMQENPEANIVDVGRKAVEIGQRFDMPQMTQKGQRIIQTEGQAIQTEQAGRQANQQQSLQKLQQNPRFQRLAFQVAQGELSATEAAKKGINLADQEGVPLSTTLRFFSQLAPEPAETDIQNIGEQGAVITRGDRVVGRIPPGGQGGGAGGGGGLRDLLEGGRGGPQAQNLPQGVVNRADEEGNFVADITDTTFGPVNLTEPKTAFEEASGVRLSQDQWEQVKNLSQRPNVSQVQALDQVMGEGGGRRTREDTSRRARRSLRQAGQQETPQPGQEEQQTEPTPTDEAGQGDQVDEPTRRNPVDRQFAQSKVESGEAQSEQEAIRQQQTVIRQILDAAEQGTSPRTIEEQLFQAVRNNKISSRSAAIIAREVPGVRETVATATPIGEAAAQAGRFLFTGNRTEPAGRTSLQRQAQ